MSFNDDEIEYIDTTKVGDSMKSFTISSIKRKEDIRYFNDMFILKYAPSTSGCPIHLEDPEQFFDDFLFGG